MHEMIAGDIREFSGTLNISGALKKWSNRRVPCAILHAMLMRDGGLMDGLTAVDFARRLSGM